MPNIVDIAVSNDNFKTLVAAVQAAGLVDTFQGPGPLPFLRPPMTPLQNCRRELCKRWCKIRLSWLEF